jgi:hypothetical protein
MRRGFDPHLDADGRIVGQDPLVGDVLQRRLRGREVDIP